MPASETRKETVEPRWGVHSRTVPLSQACPPDLSFNNIEAIEGLDTLVNLEDLSLFNNRISKIDSLDALVKLQVLSLGNNHIGNMMNVSVGAGGWGGSPGGGLPTAPHPILEKPEIQIQVHSGTSLARGGLHVGATVPHPHHSLSRHC